MNFTLLHYEKTIKSYIDNGYFFGGTKDKPLDKKNIVMVHDVDHSIEFCKNFSEIEKKCGVKSTYFLRQKIIFDKSFLTSHFLTILMIIFDVYKTRI